MLGTARFYDRPPDFTLKRARLFAFEEEVQLEQTKRSMSNQVMPRSVWESILLLLLGGFLFPPAVRAQQPLMTSSERVIVSDLLFEHFSNRDGLPDNRIRAFHQDSRGYLWVGTFNGLAKYDGYGFRKFYRQAQQNSLAGNWVNAICEDAAHNLWIGTKEGLSCFDPEQERFITYQHQPGTANSLSNNLILSLCFDQLGTLWIGTAGGLCSFDPVRKQFTRHRQNPLQTSVAKIIRSGDDHIWIATDSGPVRYNVRTRAMTHFPLQVKPGPYGERFWSLLEKDHNLYVGTASEGLMCLRYDAKSNQYTGFTPVNTFGSGSASLVNTEIYDLCQTPSGEVWVGTNRGLGYIDKLGLPDARLRLYQHNPVIAQCLSNDRVYRLFLDKNQVLWCGTEMGLNKQNLRQLPFQYFTFTNQQSKDQVRSIAADRMGYIWFGTYKSGLYLYNPADGALQRYQLSPAQSFQNFHRSIGIDSAQTVIAGTLNGAFALSANQSAGPQFLIRDNTVFALLIDSRRNQWIGTHNGLYRIGPSGKRDYFPFPAANAELIRVIFEDSRGGIWVGFENAGLFYLNPGTGQITRLVGNSAGQTLPGSTVYALIEQPRGVFWIGTESGLTKVTLQHPDPARRQFTMVHYTEKDGLPDPSINGILADKQGRLWMSTLKGLVRFTPARPSFQVYLPTLLFSHNCHYQYPDGRMLFGTSDGFVQFDPAQVTKNDAPPSVVIDNLKLFNREVGIGQTINDDVLLPRSLPSLPELRLNYQNNVFTVGFTGLHFVNPALTRYAYRLEGFDKSWIQTESPNRSATYTNLDPGTYRFQVKAANNAGRWTDEPATLQLVVLPPPWKTWWAYALYVGLFAGVLYVVGRYLLLLSSQRQQLLFEQREKEQIKQLNQLKLEFFTDISHEFRTPLTLITSPVEELLATKSLDKQTKTTLTFIQRNCQKLLHLLDELMTFQKLEQGKLKLKYETLDLVAFTREVFDSFDALADKHELQYQFTASPPSLLMPFDPDKLEKVLNNLINNAIKFTPAGGYVRVRLTPGPGREQVSLSVEDSGKGITADEQKQLFERFFQSETNKYGVGVGLSLTKSLVELHGGSITVESEPGKRTCFTVCLPAPATSLFAPVQPNEIPVPALAEPTTVEPTPAQRPEPAWGVRDERPDLLLVDDHDDIIDYLEQLFQKQYRIRKASNGLEALQRIQEREPAIIISDVKMPGMDGIELCRALKTDLSTCHIPLILLTARSTIAHQIEGIGTGADDYMPKPFHPELLRVRVETMFASRQRLLEKFRSDAMVLPKDITRNPLDEAFLQTVIDAIMGNLANDEFSVEELGELVNMSRSNLFRKLKAITGQTPVEFLYFIRLKHAQKLLLERKLTISQITFEVGFKSASAFSKAFRKQFGKAPSDYLQDAIASQLVE